VPVAMGVVGLTSGKRAVALLWAVALAAHGIEAEVRRTRSGFQVIVSGDNAVKLARLHFLYGFPLLEGDDRLKSHKLAGAVELGAGGVLSVSWEGLRKTEGGLVAADLIISVGGAAVKYNVYLLKDAIVLQFVSTDQDRVELAERLLKLAGVSVKMKKVGEGGEWHVWATTNKLATGRKELRDALAEIVRAAVENGWVDADKAERWLEKLERGRVLREGWPKYLVRLKEGALMVRFGSTNPDSVEEEARRFREMGLVEGVHFSVKMPEGGRDGYVSILKEGLAFCRLALRPRLRRTPETCRGLHKLYTGEGEGRGRKCV
jgi:Fe2+ transport system protein FeoA